MTDDRRNLALAIKSCLDALEQEAAGAGLHDLAHFVGLASLAAEDAAGAHDPQADLLHVLATTTAGHC